MNLAKKNIIQLKKMAASARRDKNLSLVVAVLQEVEKRLQIGRIHHDKFKPGNVPPVKRVTPNLTGS